MFKTAAIFGLCMAILLALLKWFEYLFFTRDLALEAYIGIVGVFCTALGSWIGWNLTKDRGNKSVLTSDISVTLDPVHPNKYNLSPRELEVLHLIAMGLSYQEIADRLSVSLSTIKTHASNIFSKMDVKRRTQAVMLAQKSGVLPGTKV